ncbi:MAG: cytidine deaminase [Gemmatimonadaceae bacterium]
MSLDPVAPFLATLHAAALGAMRHAYAPYSKFHVGAALLTEDGQVIAGCNVENASYPAGTCAERAAIGAAVAAGHRRFRAVLISTEADTPTPPCGVCRQVLAEFGTDLAVIARTTTGAEARWVLADLLPDPFTPASFRH